MVVTSNLNGSTPASIVFPVMFIVPVGDRIPLSDSSTNIVTDSGTTLSSIVENVLSLMLILATSMEVLLVPLSAIALKTVSPLFNLNEISVMFTSLGSS